ncbi:hypothetical protein FDP41_000481 [Naegleria fowleri]|uniref:RING-type domain-containing protein n=1 Tax=Naegleria fowleri TaxID=5763 RepID=A0A6A5CBZ9_NAEFO|nr:uncharacterized protein FDP41_000481 [Naegleria fowleri]KAF0984582.1 hypothetical protein FDP41_000481 [Naegleria fowleri]CAG4717963.1 unnamed protein product [Naegleria fowleri]
MNSSFFSSSPFASNTSVLVGSSEPTIHAQYLCDVCNSQPVGIRYHCEDCKNYDMCENCWKFRRNVHPSFHNFSTHGTSGSFLTNNNSSSSSNNKPSIIPPPSNSTIHITSNNNNVMNSSNMMMNVPSFNTMMNTSTISSFRPPSTNIPNHPSLQSVFYNPIPTSGQPTTTTFSKPFNVPTPSSPSVKLPSGNVIPFQPPTSTSNSSGSSSSSTATNNNNSTHVHINHSHTCQCCNKKIPTSIFQCETCFGLTPSEDYCLCRECHDSFEEFNKSGADINPIHLGDHKFKEFLDYKQLKIWKKTKEELGNQKTGGKQYSELQNLDIDEDHLLCIVCSEQLRNIVFLQCKHCVCCDGCVDSLKKVCPICRTSSDHIKIFWA